MKLLSKLSGLLLLLNALLTSCLTQAVDVNLPEGEPVVTVTARVDPVLGFEAFVAFSASPNGETTLDNVRIADAEVMLYTGSGNQLNANNRGMGFYGLPDSLIDATEEYRLEIAVSGFDTLRSEWVGIPSRAIRSRLVVSYRPDTVSIDRFITDTFRLDFSAQDPPGVNYYLVEVQPDLPNARPFLYEMFASFDSESCQVARYERPFFPDDCFEGQQFGFTYNPRTTVFDFNSQRVVYDRFRFTFSSITEVYYNYQRDRLRLDDDRGILLEPRPSTDNVSGGFGVFLGSNSFRRVVPVPR